MMSQDGLRDLGQYWLFIQGALPGVPLALGAAALGATVYETCQELGMAEVPRMWLQIVARKGRGRMYQRTSSTPVLIFEATHHRCIALWPRLAVSSRMRRR